MAPVAFRWLTLALLVLTAPLTGQSEKVSGALALSPGSLGGDVSQAKCTPDGSRILYLANQETVGNIELYSVPADGSSSAVRLSDYAQLSPSLDVTDFRISADGAYVVFGGPSTSAALSGAAPPLFSAPVDGSAPAVQLETASGYRITADSTRVVYYAPSSGIRVVAIDGSSPATTLVPPPFPARVLDLEVSPDGSRAVYRLETCNLFCDGPIELHSVLLDGSATPVLLNNPSDYAGSFRISPDSSRVVFDAGTQFGDVVALYSAPLDGSAAPVVLSAPLAGAVGFFDLDSTGQIVVHTLIQSPTVTELYSTPIDGSASAVLLNGTMVFGGNLAGNGSGVAPFQITPDAVRVVYRADQLTNDVFELFQVPIGGGTATRISRPLIAGGDVRDFQVSPDSIGVLYRANGDILNTIELCGAAYGGGSLKYNATPASGGVQAFQISPDDARVVYSARGIGGGVADEIYSVPIAGGASTKLNPALVSGGDATLGLITTDSGRVVYRADQDTDEVVELFSVPIAGGTAVQLNPELTPGPPSGDVRSFELTPDSSAVVYRADGEVPGVQHIYRTSTTAVSVTKLSVDSPEGGGIDGNFGARMTSDGMRMVYLQDPDFDTRDEKELYSVRVDGSQPPLKLSQPLVGLGQPGFHEVLSFELTADGSSIAYLAAYNGGGGRVFTVRTDGSSPAPVELTPGQNVFPSNRAPECHISPDGTRVVYTTDVGLYSAPFDGSQPPVQLSGPLVAGGAIDALAGPSFAISPDSTRVVYVADATLNERYELFTVPIDGSRAPRHLSSAFPPNGDVLEFAISPTGERVVYYGDQEFNGRFELYSVPIEGAHKWTKERGLPLPGRVKLNGPLASGGGVGKGNGTGNFAISPDGSRVVYSSTPVDKQHHDLFSAAIDGSQAPVQLTFGKGSTSDAHFSPDGERVVFGASSTLNYTLYSTRVDGTETPVQLSTGVVDGVANGLPFTVSPDGNWVVYRADDVTPDIFELYARPIDGSQSPIELSSPQVGGDVWPDFVITQDSGRILYLADHEDPNVFELYSTPLPSLP